MNSSMPAFFKDKLLWLWMVGGQGLLLSTSGLFFWGGLAGVCLGRNLVWKGTGLAEAWSGLGVALLGPMERAGVCGCTVPAYDLPSSQCLPSKWHCPSAQVGRC